jgi:hypothetical protein
VKIEGEDPNEIVEKGTGGRKRWWRLTVERS